MSEDDSVGRRAEAAPTVHVVDDDSAVRAGLELLVEALGWPVRGHGSPEELLASRALREPGCLLVDLYLRGSTAVELQHELAARGCDLPLIVVTTERDDPLVARALNAGALAVLAKPVRDAELSAALRSALPVPD